MLGQQRQMLDLKPLPPPPREMFEETAEKDYPRQTAPDQKEASGLFKKLASKLKYYPALGQLSTRSETIAKRASTTAKRISTARAKTAPPLENDFTCKEQREAALRERGLIPGKDLSQIEEDLDRKYTKTTPIPRDQKTKGSQPSAAEKIMQEWKAKNQAGRR